MKKLISLIVVLCWAGISQAAPKVEDILLANKNPNERSGLGNHSSTITCSLYETEGSTYKYVLAGGLNNDGSPVWYTPYGDASGAANVYWLVDAQDNQLVYSYNAQGDSIRFNYNPQTLIITGYQSDLRASGYSVETCQL